jgi:hypothetical protein
MSSLPTAILGVIEAAIADAPDPDRARLEVGRVASHLRLGTPVGDSGLLALPPPARLGALRHTAALGEPATPALAAAAREALTGAPDAEPSLAPLRLWSGADPTATVEALPAAHRLHAVSQALEWGAAASDAALQRLVDPLPEEARQVAELVWIQWRLERPEAPDLEALTTRVETMRSPVARLSALVALAARREAPATLATRWATAALAGHPEAVSFHAPGVADCQLAMALRLTQPRDALALLTRARARLSNLPLPGDRSLLFDALLPASAWLSLEAWRDAADTLLSDAVLRRAPELFGQTAVRAAQSIEHLPDDTAKDAGLSALLEVARSIALLPLRLVFKAEAARWAAGLPGRSAASLLGEVDTDLDRLFGDRGGLQLLPSLAASYAVADLRRAVQAAQRIRRPAHRALWLFAVADRVAGRDLRNAPNPFADPASRPGP